MLLCLPTTDDKSRDENDHKHHTARDGDQQDSGVGAVSNDPGRHWNDNYMKVTWGGAVLRDGTCFHIQLSEAVYATASPKQTPPHTYTFKAFCNAPKNMCFDAFISSLSKSLT